VVDGPLADLLNRCFPETSEAPSGAQVFSSVERGKNFEILNQLAHKLARDKTNDTDENFSKEFVRQVRACVPVESRMEFITWIFSNYLSDPRVYRYIYGVELPLAETDRKLESPNLEKLITIVTSSDG